MCENEISNATNHLNAWTQISDFFLICFNYGFVQMNWLTKINKTFQMLVYVYMQHHCLLEKTALLVEWCYFEK